MTKKEFLTELRNNLNGLPREEVEDRVNFYEEIINDRMDEGMSEEDAVADIGTTDDAVRKIASQTKMTTLVKEKMKMNRSLSGWEILFIVLGFPIWFSLLTVIVTILFVAYILTWTLVIVTYAVEAGLLAGMGACFVGFICSIIDGAPDVMIAGGTLLCLGGACIFALLCILSTKVTVKLSKNIFLGIKSKIIKGRN